MKTIKKTTKREKFKKGNKNYIYKDEIYYFITTTKSGKKIAYSGDTVK